MPKARPGEVWRAWSVSLPEDARRVFARALEMATLCGARSRVEQVEYLAVTFIQACEAEQSEWRARCTTPEARFRMDVLERDGWRCALCEHSTNLTVHHVTPRSECHASGRDDLLTDPDNGITLCAADHAFVQRAWRSYVPTFADMIARRNGALPAPTQEEPPFAL